MGASSLRAVILPTKSGRRMDIGHEQEQFNMQVLRARDKRPNRLLFSAWLQSAYIEVPLVKLKRADLDKVICRHRISVWYAQVSKSSRRSSLSGVLVTRCKLPRLDITPLEKHGTPQFDDVCSDPQSKT